MNLLFPADSFNCGDFYVEGALFFLLGGIDEFENVIEMAVFRVFSRVAELAAEVPEIYSFSERLLALSLDVFLDGGFGGLDLTS